MSHASRTVAIMTATSIASFVLVSVIVACTTLMTGLKTCTQVVTEDRTDSKARGLDVASAEPLNFFGGEPVILAALLLPTTVGPSPELHVLASLPFGEFLEANGWKRFGDVCQAEETGVVSVIVTKILPGEVPGA